jgi:predicted transcriptional regulator
MEFVEVSTANIRERIRAEIRRLLGTSPDGCGWYSLEKRFGIARQEFPPHTNIMTFLTELEAEGEVERKTVDGKERYVVVVR